MTDESFVTLPASLVHRLYGMALFNSCLYEIDNDPDADPFANCDDWSEVVAELAPLLGKSPVRAEPSDAESLGLPEDLVATDTLPWPPDAQNRNVRRIPSG